MLSHGFSLNPSHSMKCGHIFISQMKKQDGEKGLHNQQLINSEPRVLSSDEMNEPKSMKIKGKVIMVTILP